MARTIYCSVCRRNGRRNHLSTLGHRNATRPRGWTGATAKARPAWTIALRGEYQGSDEENAAAAARLGIAWS